MSELFSRLINLIGKGQDHPVFEKLCQDLGTPEVHLIEKHLKIFEFPTAGVGFEYEGGAFVAVHFNFDTASTRSGGCNKYTGDLPAAICLKDQRLAVKQKLNVEPVCSKRFPTEDPEDPAEYWDYYCIEGLTANFSFSGTDEHLMALSVRPPVKPS